MTLRISTTLVQTDVTVLDKQGRFVEGLKPEQFQVKVDGKPQRIDLFNRVTAGTPEEAAQFAAARGEAPKAGTKVSPLNTGQTIFFFVDDLHITPERIARVKSVVLNYIDNEMQPGDQALIVQASGQLGFLQQLTDNKTVLRTAASKIKFNPISNTDNERPKMSPYEAYAIDVGKRDVLEYKMVEYRQANSGLGAVPRPALENILRQKASNILRNAKLLNVAMLSTLETVLRGSSAVKGRKLLFFLSEGMLVDQRDREISTRLNRVVDVAARAGVIFYTVDVRGLAVGGPEAADDVFPSFAATDQENPFNQSSAMDVAMEEASEVLRPLRALAYDTGGRPLINNNGLDKNVKQALSEYQNYYLLAWEPEEFEPGKTKFRRIEVKIKDRPDLRVMVRSGFFSNPVPEAKPEPKLAKDGTPIIEDTLTAAVRAAYERRELPFSVYPVWKNEASGSSVIINLEVSSTVNSPANAEHPNQEIDLVYVLLDLNGKLIATDGKKLSYAQAPGMVATLMHQFTAPLTVAGTYQVRVGARDALGRISTRFDWIEAPTFASGKLTLSSLLLSERKAKTTQDPLLNIERRFARSSRLLLQVYVYNAARKTADAKPDVTMEIDVLRKGVSVLNAPQHPLVTDGATDPDRIPYSAEIPLRGLSPGTYSLRIKAIDRSGKTEVVQSANFVVE
ncbi:MAG: VWA domain-containing protein [Acidobacteriota bacterium]|nr:VWA domain-containing protein [Acidobacteriota bacterium]